MFKISLKNFAAAGRTLHRNILKPTAQPRARDAAAPAAFYEAPRAGGAQPRTGTLGSKLAALFQAPKPKASPLTRAAAPSPLAAPEVNGGRRFAGFAAAGLVVTPEQLPQVREQTLQQARGFAAPRPAMAAGMDRRQAVAQQLGRSRLHAGPQQAQALPAQGRMPGPEAPWVRPLVETSPHAAPRPAQNGADAPRRRQGAGLTPAPQPRRPLKPAADALSPRQRAVLPPAPQPRQPLRPAAVAPKPRDPAVDAPAQTPKPGRAETAAQGSLRPAKAAKRKAGKGKQRTRTLLTAGGGSITYDKSHVQGGYGRFHRAQLADGTPRGLKQVRLPDNAKQGPRKNMGRTPPPGGGDQGGGADARPGDAGVRRASHA